MFKKIMKGEVVIGRPLSGLGHVLKANPYHDERGRFATQDTARFVSTSGVFSGKRPGTKSKRPEEVLDGPELSEVLEYKYGLWQSKTGSTLAKDGSDIYLAAILKAKGFDKKPKLVSAEDLDKAISDGDYEAMRGVVSYVPPPSNEDMVKSFKEGHLYAGKGVFGGGTYSLTNKAAKESGKSRAEIMDDVKTIIESYAAGREEGLIRMALSKKAKVVDFEELKAEQKAFIKKSYDEAESHSPLEQLKAWGKKEGIEQVWGDSKAFLYMEENQAKFEKIYKDAQEKHQKLYEVVQDVGRFAALQGYDAFHVKAHDYLVVLNRGALKVQKEKVEVANLFKD